jgi:pre-rRNA-processing protein TSR4
MWTDNDDDFNSEGEAVRLYRPIIYGKRPPTDDLTCSFIGGETTVDEPPTCSSCQESLPLMLQLFVPKFPATNQDPTDRTLQIFACNRAACVNALTTNDSKFSYGGAGVVVCRRLTIAPTVPKDDAIMSKPSPAEAQDSWVDGQGAGDDNDWAMDGAVDSDMQDLESKLAIMETMKVQPKKAKTPAPPKKSSKSKEGSFPCYELSALQEPRSVRKEGLDEDDVGFSGSDAKIKAMLARYMAEEDDDFILAALKGSASGGEGGGGDGRGERDERLSPADRALLTYSDRLKRSPRQVARYALGGIPMWSM